jgi:hypothetical protein
VACLACVAAARAQDRATVVGGLYADSCAGYTAKYHAWYGKKVALLQRPGWSWQLAPETGSSSFGTAGSFLKGVTGRKPAPALTSNGLDWKVFSGTQRNRHVRYGVVQDGNAAVHVLYPDDYPKGATPDLLKSEFLKVVGCVFPKSETRKRFRGTMGTRAKEGGEPHFLVQADRERFVYLDREGNEVLTLSPRIRSARGFSGGLAAVQERDANRWGYIDATGRLRLPFAYHEAGEFSEGLAPVATTVTTEKPAGGPGMSLGGSGGLRRVGGWAFIDTEGKTVLRAPKGISYATSAFAGGLAVVPVEGLRYALIDRTGKRLGGLDFKFCTGFSEGLAYVNPGGEGAGFIDRSGAVVLPGPFRFASRFRDGLAAVTLADGTMALIDKTGQKVLDLHPKDGTHCRDGLRLKYHPAGKTFGYVDRAGLWRIPPRFHQARPFSGGFAAVMPEKPTGRGFGKVQKWGYVDRGGKLVLPAQYRVAGGFDVGIARVRTLDGRTQFIRPDGTVVWPKG